MTEQELAGVLPAHRNILRMLLKAAVPQDAARTLRETRFAPAVRAEVDEVLSPGSNPDAIDLIDLIGPD